MKHTVKRLKCQGSEIPDSDLFRLRFQCHFIENIFAVSLYFYVTTNYNSLVVTLITMRFVTRHTVQKTHLK